MSMNKNSKLPNFVKPVLLVFVVFVIGCLIYHPSATENPEKLAAEKTVPTVSSVQGKPLNDSIVAYGMGFLGTPYIAAGCGKDGFDCSGFVYFVFQHFKIEVPRSAAAFENFGKDIPIEDLQKGDLLLFLSPTRNVIGHIGIVSTANGKESSFIHASSGAEMKVIVTSLTKEGYKRRFVKAVRVL